MLVNAVEVRPKTLLMNMKNYLFILLAVCFTDLALSQQCTSVYVFDPLNKEARHIICNDIETEGIKASGKTCAIQTSTLPIKWSQKASKEKLYVNALFRCTPDLEAGDFVWIYFRFNGILVKTITVKGEAGKETIRITDSIDVPKGTKVTMRAAMVCNQPGESIWLEKGLLEVCQKMELKKIEEPETSASSSPSELISMQPILSVSNMVDRVRISWKCGKTSLPNYFRLERTDEKGNWTIAGYTQDICKTDKHCEYVFHDTSANESTIGYRIVRVDSKGKEFILVEEARPVN